MGIDEIRDYWNRSPCNIRHSDVNIDADPLTYSRQVSQRKRFVEPHIWTHAEPQKWEYKRVLDLGCGIGTQSLMFARNNAWVTAVDLSEKSLEIARIRAAAEGLSAITWLQGNFEDLPHILSSYPQNYCFDLVYAFGTVHHTPDPLKALRQAWDVTTPGGELRLMLYHRYSWKAAWVVATYGKMRFWKWAQLVQQYSEAQEGSPCTHTYSRREARQLCEQAGWQVYDLRVDHIFPYQIGAYKQKQYVREWWARVPFFRQLERLFGWHILIKARKPCSLV